jgi:hypothetical protein
LKKQLHIICLDVPWPADYGGAIDMMNRIIALHKTGIAIHLHYFSYNQRGTPNELNQFCDQLSVYERKSGWSGIQFGMPYIVSSRINRELTERIRQDNHPVLIEGIHSTGILPSLDLSTRKVVVRVHNDESVYYRQLARAERALTRKFFFRRESRLLKRYQSHLPETCIYACLSPTDMQTFHNVYKKPRVCYLPASLSWQEVHGPTGMGNFCLYHGNLSVAENEEAALWLLEHVFNRVHKPFVIAGKAPSKKLERAAHRFRHTCLVADPTDSELNDLIQKAHINLLPSLNREQTGIRLKLLHALYEGRHCITNPAMVTGTGLEDACHIAGNAEAMASIVLQLYHQPYSEEESSLRRRLLGNTYDNARNTRELIQYLW